MESKIRDMKGICTLLAIALSLQIGLSESLPVPIRNISGKWFSNYTNTVIRVKAKRDGIKVKGLRGIRSWRTFDYVGRNRFKDCYGNQIKVNPYNELIFQNVRNRSQAVFTKRQGNSYQPRDRDYWRQSSYRDSYYVRELNETIYLQTRGDQLRAKRQGGEWVYYSQNPYRKNEYRDYRGNRYIISGSESYTWVSNAGGDVLHMTNNRRAY